MKKTLSLALVTAMTCLAAVITAAAAAGAAVPSYTGCLDARFIKGVPAGFADGVDDAGPAYSPGLGLVLNGTELNVEPEEVQRRVVGGCAEGSAIRTIAQDGSVACQPDTCLAEGTVRCRRPLAARSQRLAGAAPKTGGEFQYTRSDAFSGGCCA